MHGGDSAPSPHGHGYTIRSGSSRPQPAGSLDNARRFLYRHLLLSHERGLPHERSRLRRLPAEHYHGHAYVHWALTLKDRKQGWLTDSWHRTFREILTHSLGRFHLACPMYCLMPDHVHMLWVGHSPHADQLKAMTHFRRATNKLLLKPTFAWQDQAYEHVLKDDEREKGAFEVIAEYIHTNPLRAGLVSEEDADVYNFRGCLVPGYPDLDPRQENYWELFWRIYRKLHRQ